MPTSSTSLDLAGRALLITGASSGLGAHLSRAAATRGAAVALAARRTDRMRDLVDAIADQGGKAVAVAMDVADEASITAGFDAAEAAIGPITSVLANAGLNIPGPALDLTAADYDSIMSVNLRGVFLTAREGARRMITNGSKDKGDGRIVLVGSVGSHRVLPGLMAYSTSKAGVLMMGKSLAREWANRGINVNVVMPGWIKTELNSEWLESPAGQRLIDSFPRKRVMAPEDLEAVTFYLLSDACRAITGGGFELDDGQSI
ncbi:SDR family oxidoreductase [Sphingomonas sp. MG17]|uniref:SDR family oxidoreductase n=1 Tax=Sphingomonas tagetis TaxID=2949092 RepID=A0A9X2HPR1_9SPHN|nr:SDR family oxidoreductase [Sphingomonas tagetis]MCP3731268.1 SDR family oxidoreductase [Sphingomonas tagetis]